MAIGRRDIIRGGILGSVTYVGMSASTTANAQPLGGNLITVGTGGDADYSDIRDAMESISNSNKANPYTILLLPGVHALGFRDPRPLVCKPYVSITSLDRRTCRLKLNKWRNIRYTHMTSLSNFTIEFASNDVTLGAIEPVANSEALSQTRSELIIQNIRVEVSGPGIGIKLRKLRRGVLRSCEIVSQTTGLDFKGYTSIEVFDTNVWVVPGSNGHAPSTYRCVLDQGTSGRVWWWGGKIGSGYPYDDINDPNANVFAIVQIKTKPNSLGGRFELFNVWSIIRNDAVAGVNVLTQNVRSSGGWVRVHGGYFQAEDGIFSTREGTAEFANDTDHPGKIEIYPDVRYKKFLGTTVQIGPAAGIEFVNTNTQWQVGFGGLKLIDASSGPLLLSLPRLASIGEEYTLKRTDDSGNDVTIIMADGAPTDGSIDGQHSISLGTAQYSSLQIKNAGESKWFVLNRS